MKQFLATLVHRWVFGGDDLVGVVFGLVTTRRQAITHNRELNELYETVAVKQNQVDAAVREFEALRDSIQDKLSLKLT